MCFEAMHLLLPELFKIDQEKTKEMVVNSNIIINALKQSTNRDYAVKLKSTNLLLEIWALFPSVISKKQSLGL
jgi:DNA-binding sugar fermentation-stimulating protein